MKHGPGEELFSDSNQTFEGVWINDKKHGKFKITELGKETITTYYYHDCPVQGSKDISGTPVYKDKYSLYIGTYHSEGDNKIFHGIGTKLFLNPSN